MTCPSVRGPDTEWHRIAGAVCGALLLLAVGACAPVAPPPLPESPPPAPPATATQAANPLSQAPAAQPSTPATQGANPTPTRIATATLTATPTQSPSPTPTPAPALRQLLTGGCCVNPSWSPEGDTVRFLDRPTAQSVAGIYEVAADVPAPIAAGELVTTTIPTASSGGRFVIVSDDSGSTISDRQTDQSHFIPDAEEQVMVSPGGKWVVWRTQEPNSGTSFRDRLMTVWVAALDGSGRRAVATLRGGSLTGWLGDEALLVQRRDEADQDERLLLRLDLDDGTQTVLDRALRFNGLLISPGGPYVAYYVSLDQDDPAQNGLWLLDTTSGSKQALPVIGAYRWRDASRLL